MLIDVSEIKSFRTCRRQHLFSSRNRLHLAPKATPRPFYVGKLFHNALHKLYLGVELDKVMDEVRESISEPEDNCLLAMIPGYYEHVLPGDLERFIVLDIEHRFSLEGPRGSNISIVGSIDMVALDVDTQQIFGFEHKSTQTFRDDTMLWMDEQPRLYTMALLEYVKKYNKKYGTDVTFGGIYLNEVKKLMRQFQFKRTLCVYPKDDLQNFMQGIYKSCLDIATAVATNDVGMPCPSFMNCKLCSYSGICATYMYSTINLEELLEEFQEEFEVREVDHLDEDKGGEEFGVHAV